MKYCFLKELSISEMKLYKKPNDTDITIRIDAAHSISEAFLKYSHDYRKAAHMLAECVIKTANNAQRDRYILPIGFLYRNSLELITKAIALKKALNIESFIAKNNHNISGVLKQIKPFVKEIINNDVKMYNWLWKYLEELEKFDKASDLFRYPFKLVVEKDNVKKSYKLSSLFENRIDIDVCLFANKFEIAYGIIKSYYNEEMLNDKIYREFNPILFQRGVYEQTSIVGGLWFENNYQPFIDAYTECAAFLRESILKDLDSKQLYFNPMCYLYRNTIELQLKKIIVERGNEQMQAKLQVLDCKNKHSIEHFWNKAVKYIKEFNTSFDAEDEVERVEKMIRNLQSDDPHSDRYRYPINRRGKLFWEKHQTINFNNHVEYFETIITFLDRIDNNIEMYYENLAENQMYYR